MYTACCDGGARSNPGPAAYAAVIEIAGGSTVEISGYLGVQTNNVAEYHGLLAILEYVSEAEVKAVTVYSDSLLVVSQISGNWKIKNKDLKPLWEKCKALIAKLDYFEIVHIPRCENIQADALVNKVLDREAIDKDSK